MQKIFFLVLFSLCAAFSALSQEATQDTAQAAKPQDKLATLLDEREQLSMEYQYLNSQNSNFWGKKSKKDLVQIIQTLKNIINKDSEIIREINTMNLKTRAQSNVETGRIKRQVVGDQRVTMENLYQLRQDLASAHNLHKVKDRELTRLREELKETRQGRQKTHLIITAAGATCVLLLVYIFMLRSKIPARKTKTRKKST